MLSIQDTRSSHWTSPADVVLLPSLVKAATDAYCDAHALPPLHQVSSTTSMPALPSISSLLHRHAPPSPEPHYPTYSYHSSPQGTMQSAQSTMNMAMNMQVNIQSTDVVTKPRWRLSKYCTVDGCERVSQRNGLCHRHGGKRSCKEETCRAKDRGNGYCIRHGGGRPCDVANCGKKARRQGMCTQHYRVVHPN